MQMRRDVLIKLKTRRTALIYYYGAGIASRRSDSDLDCHCKVKTRNHFSLLDGVTVPSVECGVAVGVMYLEISRKLIIFLETGKLLSGLLSSVC